MKKNTNQPMTGSAMSGVDLLFRGRAFATGECLTGTTVTAFGAGLRAVPAIRTRGSHAWRPPTH